MSKRLFIAELEAQFMIWRKVIVHEATKVDEVFQLGNILSISENMKDGEKYGPNESILNFVDLYSGTHDGWKQIIGPNEITILNQPGRWTNDRTDHKLRSKYFSEDPFFKIAEVSGSRLVSHGGLTHGEWISLGRPETASEAAKLLNEKYARSLYMGESYLITGKPNFSANPVFADPLLETYPSWIGSEDSCPFPQMHAGRSLNSRVGRAMVASDFGILRFIDKVSYRRTGSYALINGAIFGNVSLNLPGSRAEKLPEGSSLLVERERVSPSDSDETDEKSS